MNMGQDSRCGWFGATGGNQLRQYAGRIGINGYNAKWQIGVKNIGNGNVVAARAEGNANGNNGNQIRCYNCRGLRSENLMLIHARGTVQYDQEKGLLLSSDSVVECSIGRSQEIPTLTERVTDESLAKHKALELEIERLLRAVVSQDIMSIVQNPTSVVDSSTHQTEA
ncbi:hypothetical protein Tco_0655275 [Tanacetum coccineum]|uniref:Uncharacterized protein n=1 Tax=Tanacetum coccineum TaxID=301880 RepID=A0ABQ4X5K1_9ASTR